MATMIDPVYIVVGAIAVGLLAGVGYFILRARSRPKEIVYEHFNCPHCKRRLRYQSKQAGHSGQCPRCRGTLTFPR
jgi:DNA-directed RNA polymerase subunit RPC12/RpoP